MIIMFCGKIASGKTSLSRSLAAALNYRWASFGNLVRKEAEKRGLPLSREVLQDLGESLVREDVKRFCVMFLEEWHPGEPLVVDGLRHLEVLEEFRAIDGDVRLIYVYAGADTRLMRLLKRGEEITTRIENHPVEIDDGDMLIKQADLLVDSSLPLEENVRFILSWIEAVDELKEEVE